MYMGSIKLSPALTDFKEANVFFCYWRISNIAKIKNIKNFSWDLRMAAVIGEFTSASLAGPLERDSTVQVSM